MKKQNKKTPITRSKWFLMSLAVIATGAVIGFIYWNSVKEPSWKYAQSFQDDRFLISVEKTSKQYKHSQEYFFLIHTYDFNTNTYKEVIKIPIQEDMDYQSEYMGYSNHYIWLKTPDWTAVDMLSSDHPVLEFDDLKKRICAKNPEQFTDLIELAKVENYLRATNQNGDQFYVNLETFTTAKTAPVPYYDAYYKSYTIMSELPKFAPGSQYAGNFYTVATVGNMDYHLKPISESNPIKRSFFSVPNDSTYQILKVSATDSIRNASGAVPHVVTIKPKETSLTDLSFINAVGLGVVNNCFVFRYQKTVDAASPWYLAWFDLKTKSVAKEVNLETKGLKLESPTEFLSHWVSIDGKWAFFAIENKTPVRIKL